MTTSSILLIIYCITMPFIALALSHKFSWAKVLGPVLISCAFGILVANQPFITWDEATAKKLAKTSELISSGAIPLAIPLLLFQCDLTSLRAQGKKTLLSFVLAVVSVFVGVMSVTMWYGDALGAKAHVSGMLMSVYIGGTPNLVAVQNSLKASDATFGLVYASATFVSSFYLLFLLTVAKPLLKRVFPAHPAPEEIQTIETQTDEKKTPWLQYLKWGGFSLAASILCVVISAGLTKLITGKLLPLGIVLGITTLSVVFSFWKRLRNTPTNEPIGTYLILVFCVSAGTMMDIGKLLASGSVILSFTAWSVLAFLTLHFLLHRLFRIDVDTTITMSVATMFGPPFIPPVVQAIGNRAVMLPGMTMGFLGYAVGTYLGIAVGSLL